MQLRYRTGLTGEQYVTAQAWRSATLPRCPNHPGGDCALARHGTYQHKTPPGTKIAHWYCRRSHTTFSLLPVWRRSLPQSGDPYPSPTELLQRPCNDAAVTGRRWFRPAASHEATTAVSILHYRFEAIRDRHHLTDRIVDHRFFYCFPPAVLTLGSSDGVSEGTSPVSLSSGFLESLLQTDQCSLPQWRQTLPNSSSQRRWPIEPCGQGLGARDLVH